MERLNRATRQFSKENSVSRNVCVNGTNRIEQEICNDSCCKISYSHDLSSDNLNKSLGPEEYVPAYRCDKPSGYVFVDVGSNLIESVYLLEENDDICKVSSETLFTDSKDIDYNLIKNVTIERRLKNSSKENEMHNHNLETTVFNINDICTGNDRSGLSTNACMTNMCENLDNCDKKPSIDIDYTTTLTDISASGGFEKVNTCVKEEKCIEDVLVPQSTKTICPEVKKEEMVYNEEVSVLNESIIDIKLHPVNKVEELPDIRTNYSCVLDENSKTELIVLSKSVNSDFQEVHTECLEEVSDNSDIGNVVLKPLEKNETVQNTRDLLRAFIHLKLQNKVQTLNRTCSELQIKEQTNSGDDIGAAGVEACNNKLNEDDVNTQVKNKNDAVCQHHRKRKSKNTTDRHYVCKACDKYFMQLCDLKVDKCTHTDDRPFGCDTCGKAFTRVTSLKHHKLIHTGDRPFGCGTCGKAFAHDSDLKKHKCIRTGDRPFGCITCGKALIQLAELEAQKHIYTGDRPFGCSTCGNTFRQLAHLNGQKRIHTGERRFGCDTCGKTFNHMGHLKDHIRIHTGERPFGCVTCGKAFTHVTSLNRHKLIHTGDRPFGCDTCGKTFTQLTTLKCHKRIHTGERPFVCDTCGKAFTRMNCLMRHKLIHTGERPFGCNTCGKAFRRLENLKDHKCIQSGERAFGCDTCGKAFRALASLNTHKHKHTGKKPFVCSTCGKAFTHLRNLKKHKQVHIKEKPLNCKV